MKKIPKKVTCSLTFEAMKKIPKRGTVYLFLRLQKNEKCKKKLLFT